MSISTDVSEGPLDVVVVGGCGHVGLPLAIAFADCGLRVCSYDVDVSAVKTVNSGELPFREDGAEEVLRRALERGMYCASAEPSVVARADVVVIVIGTPVDEHLNPDANAVPAALGECFPHMHDGQMLVLRSTVYPGVTRRVERLVRERSLSLDVAFCPERIAEGKAMEELRSLPQIVAARTDRVRQRAAALFSHLTSTIVELEPEEAELAKLFTNSWRYIKFAAANQFFMMANDNGLDFDRIRTALAVDYPRAADMPGAGFAAGPCLLKDTMQLAAFTDNRFVLGHSAMLVNEGLPMYLVSHLESRYELDALTVGILGTAFKGESDDIRSSLAYKLKRILQFRAKAVLTTDPYVSVDPSLESLETVLSQSDVLIVAAPHQQYAQLLTDKPVIDIWNLRGQGNRI
ncbi:MAG: nucleotide sugar dehydrogenase [Actinomycetota bacterium]|nr:nucleotide sugar dehydrogenase [Actinomycetota bacterium]